MTKSNTEVRDIISRALRARKRGRRHPAEVTSDRLGDTVTRYGDQLSGTELDAIALVRQALEEIAEGSR